MAPRTHCLLVFLLSFGLRPSNVLSKSDWDYDRGGDHGPSNWPGLCQSGSRQSPVDIVVKHAAPVKFGALHFHNYDNSLYYSNATLHNNGHTVALESQWNGSAAHVKDGGLESVYLLHHVHFHAPSEHTLNGRRYPLEAHLVHRDYRSASLEEASKTRDGIAVLGVLFQISDEPNQQLRDLTDALERLDGEVDGRVNLRAIKGAPMSPDVFLPQKKAHFFRYYGSLTTPQCQEAVVWTVFEKAIPLSEGQLKMFQMPESNFRPVQNLNRRVVLHNTAGACFEEKTSSGASTRLPLPAIPILLTLLSILPLALRPALLSH